MSVLPPDSWRVELDRLFILVGVPGANHLRPLWLQPCHQLGLVLMSGWSAWWRIGLAPVEQLEGVSPGHPGRRLGGHGA